jgi:hypothetical protein
MDRHRIVRGRWARLITHLLHISRPLDGKRLCAPFSFEEGTIRALRRAVHGASDIRQPHFDRVGWRPLCLLGRWVAQATAGGTHVPEIAAYKIALAGIVMQNGREWGIGVCLRLTVAETRAH